MVASADEVLAPKKRAVDITRARLRRSDRRLSRASKRMRVTAVGGSGSSRTVGLQVLSPSTERDTWTTVDVDRGLLEGMPPADLMRFLVNVSP